MEALSLFDAHIEAAPVASPLPPRVRHAPGRSTAPSPSGPRLLAVDGNSLAHRAFHAYPPGGPGPVYGFLALLSAICDRVGPDGVVVGFDCPRGSARRDRYPPYKAHRPGKDPALVTLLDDLPGVLGDLCVRVVIAPGWEADDVLGSAAAAAAADGWRCVLATSDRDAFALISPTTTVLRLRSGMDNAVDVDARRLLRSVGVRPDQYVQFAALRGDTSDNLPGVPGIGRRRAADLLRAYPTVEEACADPLGCRSVLGPALGQALLDDVASQESRFRRNVGLMTIRRDVPVDLAGCRPRATAGHLAERLAARRLPGLAGRLAVALAVRPEPAPPPGDADAP